MQPRKITISVPHPCAQSWDEMSQVEKGRFCQSCKKTVIDFSDMSDQQLIAAMHSRSANSCGRFVPSQLNRELVPATDPQRPLLFTAVFASFLAMITPAAKAVPTTTIQLSVDTFSNQNEHITSADSTDQFITGQIVDREKNTILQGAWIQLKGTQIHTISDKDGNFRLLIPAEQVKTCPTLTIAMIAYMSFEVRPEMNAQGTFSPLHLKMDEYYSLGLGEVVYKQTRWQRLKSKLKRSFYEYR